MGQEVCSSDYCRTVTTSFIVSWGSWFVPFYLYDFNRSFFWAHVRIRHSLAFFFLFLVISHFLRLSDILTVLRDSSTSTPSIALFEPRFACLRRVLLWKDAPGSLLYYPRGKSINPPY
ncbi:hypothetical protein EDD17DRAFT_427385 [Pisolithus thermaeus]|nr:hypothetical protein EDD17DRAFT_427385 [Pisolithus thermaeus]